MDIKGLPLSAKPFRVVAAGQLCWVVVWWSCPGPTVCNTRPLYCIVWILETAGYPYRFVWSAGDNGLWLIIRCCGHCVIRGKARVLASYRSGIGESTSKGEFRFGTMWGRNDYHAPCDATGRYVPEPSLAGYGLCLLRHLFRPGLRLRFPGLGAFVSPCARSGRTYMHLRIHRHKAPCLLRADSGLSAYLTAHPGLGFTILTLTIGSPMITETKEPQRLLIISQLAMSSPSLTRRRLWGSSPRHQGRKH